MKLIEFDTNTVGLYLAIGDSHITYFGHVGNWYFGESTKYYRMKCPMCWGHYPDPWENWDCHVCNDTERVNIVRWVWWKFLMSDINDRRSMVWHWLKTGEKIW